MRKIKYVSLVIVVLIVVWFTFSIGTANHSNILLKPMSERDEFIESGDSTELGNQSSVQVSESSESSETIESSSSSNNTVVEYRSFGNDFISTGLSDVDSIVNQSVSYYSGYTSPDEEISITESKDSSISELWHTYNLEFAGSNFTAQLPKDTVTSVKLRESDAFKCIDMLACQLDKDSNVVPGSVTKRVSIGVYTLDTSSIDMNMFNSGDVLLQSIFKGFIVDKSKSFDKVESSDKSLIMLYAEGNILNEDEIDEFKTDGSSNNRYMVCIYYNKALNKLYTCRYGERDSTFNSFRAYNVITYLALNS